MSDRPIPFDDIETALVTGDLAKLTPDQRVNYYTRVCKSLGLNPLTRPFDYINLNGRLTLYARKDATDQLRKTNGISIDKPDIAYQDEWIIVTVTGEDKTGRRDSDIGVVNRKDMRGDFGNALMKAITKAKRRLTLSICGLGFLDETEVETIPDARPVVAELPQPAEPGHEPLTYQDGSITKTDAERLTFVKYLAVHQNNPPKNVYNLRNWYKTAPDEHLEAQYEDRTEV